MHQIRYLAAAAALLAAAFLPSVAHAAFPGTNGQIAFGRAGDILLTGPGGGGVVPITHDGLSDTPAWSPDGTRIALALGTSVPPGPQTTLRPKAAPRAAQPAARPGSAGP
jgi:hypothetical protein